MASLLQIDQAGLPAGTPGEARTDGLDGGELVTLTNTGPGTTTFALLWVPPEDTTAVGSLAVTGNPDIWTFSPTAGVYGTYLVELTQDSGLPGEIIERRVFGIRTPNKGLLVPALNERGHGEASLVNSGASFIEAADNNSTDSGNAFLDALPYSAWWRSYHEMIVALDALDNAGPPLNQTFFVDSLIGNDATGEGTLSKPFATVQAAIDLTTSSGVWMIMVSPGTYAAAITIPDSREIVITGAGGGSTVSPATTIGAIGITSSAVGTKSLTLSHLQSGTITITGAILMRVDLEHAVVSGNVTGAARLTITGTRRAAGSTSQITGSANVDFDLYASGALISNVGGTSNLQADYTFISSLTAADGVFLRNNSIINATFSGTISGALNLNNTSSMTLGSAATVTSNVNVDRANLTMNGTVNGVFNAIGSTLIIDLTTASFDDDFQVKDCDLLLTGSTLSVGGDVCRISNCNHESATASPLTVTFTGPAGFLYADSESITRTLDSSNVVQNGVTVTNGTFIQTTRPSARTRTLYVDGGVGDNIVGNGTESLPYATVQAAVDTTSNDGTYHIIISPGDYTGDGTIAIPDSREIVFEAADSVCGAPAPINPAVELGDVTITISTNNAREAHFRHMQVGDVTVSASGGFKGMVTLEHAIAGAVSGDMIFMAWGSHSGVDTSTTQVTSVTAVGSLSTITATGAHLPNITGGAVTLYGCSGSVIAAANGMEFHNCDEMSIIGGSLGSTVMNNSTIVATGSFTLTGQITIHGGYFQTSASVAISSALTAYNAQLLFAGTSYGTSVRLNNCSFTLPAAISMTGTEFSLLNCANQSSADITLTFSGSAGTLNTDRVSNHRIFGGSPGPKTFSVSNGTITVLGDSEYTLTDGFFLDVLPIDDARVTIGAAGNTVRNITLTDGLWYSMTVEVVIKDDTGVVYYIYRNQIECYRDGGGAVIHLDPSPPIVEEAAGGDFSVTIGTSTNDVTVTVANAAGNSVDSAIYIGYTRKPIP